MNTYLVYSPPVRKCRSMTTYMLGTVFTWTFKGILCTCRFLWICPYNAIRFLPRENYVTEGTRPQVKPPVGFESKAAAAIPGSPDRTTGLDKRLTRAEKDILSLKTRVACERVSWERRFAELQRKQEELQQQLTCEAAVLGLVVQSDHHGDSGVVENAEVFDEQSSLSTHMYRHGGCDTCSSSLSDSHLSSSSALRSRFASSSSSVSSVRSWRSCSPGPHRVFVPHSAMDLQLGHRVRIMLPSGRISTGTIRYLGHLQGEPDLHLGVELQTPDHGQQGGSHRGHSYFECKPGYGAFVPFHKLLMAWE